VPTPPLQASIERTLIGDQIAYNLYSLNEKDNKFKIVLRMIAKALL